MQAEQSIRPAGAADAAARALGVTLVAGAALLFALAGVMTKSISANSLAILCWRGLVGGIVITLYVLWRHRGGGGSWRLGRGGWLLTIVSSLSSIAFISAFKLAYVANVTIIYATIPFAAAVCGWLLLGERVERRTLAAALLSFLGVCVMVFAGVRSGATAGNGLAVLMTLLSALHISLIRRFRDAPVVWAAAVSSFQLFGLGWLVTDPMAITRQDAILLVLFGLSFSAAVVMFTEGARLVPAAEAALIGLAEVPTAILLAWIALAEIPAAASLSGGAVVLAALLWHLAHDWMSARAAARPG